MFMGPRERVRVTCDTPRVNKINDHEDVNFHIYEKE